MIYLILRSIASLVLCISIVLIPWWLWIVCAGIMVAAFPRYYEVVFLALIHDVVTGSPTPGWWYPYTLLGLGMVGSIEYIKTKLIIY